MAEYVSLDHLKFLISEVLEIEDILSLSRFKDYDIESVEMLLDSVKDYADIELYPYFAEMDRHGAKYEDGTITCHPQIKKILRSAGENGYICSHFDYEKGGTQMPHIASIAANIISNAANNASTGYVGLTSGAASLIHSFGNKELFDTYVPKMMSGKWCGTMALTEPQAGSSLSDIETSGEKNDDGSYSIKGQKIFISGGDHQCAENFVHLTLARIKGAPSGTSGISLFVIPKMRIEEDTLVNNDVYTAGEYEKMGQRGYVTAHLVFGENQECKGWLVGEENKGLKYMFQMMNNARLEVGMTAAAIASAAYHASLQYAKERPQGRKLDRDGDKDVRRPQTLIINHPDVRRMLLLQKAIVEGSTSLLCLCAKYLDFSHYSQEESEKQKYHDLLEILTPIAKTYPSEMGQISVSNGLQILGGYGFTTDFPLEQLYRDIRITALYEGTTGIQSLDLLGRKIINKNGAALHRLLEEINISIQKASTYDDLKPHAQKLEDVLQLMNEVLEFLINFAMQGRFGRFLSDATIFMEFSGIIVIAWQWLMMSTSAKRALVTGNQIRSSAFYEAQIHTMKFFFKYELPKTKSLAETLLSEEVLTTMEEEKAAKVFS